MISHLRTMISLCFLRFLKSFSGWVHKTAWSLGLLSQTGDRRPASLSLPSSLYERLSLEAASSSDVRSPRVPDRDCCFVQCRDHQRAPEPRAKGEKGQVQIVALSPLSNAGSPNNPLHLLLFPLSSAAAAAQHLLARAPVKGPSSAQFLKESESGKKNKTSNASVPLLNVAIILGASATSHGCSPTAVSVTGISDRFWPKMLSCAFRPKGATLTSCSRQSEGWKSLSLCATVCAAASAAHFRR